MSTAGLLWKLDVKSMREALKALPAETLTELGEGLARLEALEQKYDRVEAEIAKRTHKAPRPLPS